MSENSKEKRLKTILDIQADISYENNKRYLHRKVDVLIEGTLRQDHSLLVGRGWFQAPEVDGVVWMAPEKSRPEVFNTIQKVEITDGDVYDLYGILIG